MVVHLASLSSVDITFIFLAVFYSHNTNVYTLLMHIEIIIFDYVLNCLTIERLRKYYYMDPKVPEYS